MYLLLASALRGADRVERGGVALTYTLRLMLILGGRAVGRLLFGVLLAFMLRVSRETKRKSARKLPFERESSLCLSDISP